MKQIILIILGLSTFIYADFTRDDVNGTVTDRKTGLVWQDDQVVGDKDWESAIDYCEALTLGGKEWRLPNKKELFSIVDHSRTSPSMSPVFEDVTGRDYWSSTSVTGLHYRHFAWPIKFDRGYIGIAAKTASKYVRCVSAGE